MKKHTQYKSHALIREICSFLDEYGEYHTKITLIMYKKYFMLLESTHYKKHICYYVKVLIPKETKKLMKELGSETSKHLFDVIADSFIIENKESELYGNFEDFCELRHIETDTLSSFYSYNKESFDFIGYVLNHFRRCFINKSDNSDNNPKLPIDCKLKSTRNSRVLCKYIDRYGTVEQISLFIYKTCFFYVRSCYYNDHISSDVVGVSSLDTKRLMTMLKADNNNQLFAAFKKAFIHPDEETLSFGEFIDSCGYSNLFYDRLSCTYDYNLENISFTKFLLNEFSASHAVFKDKR